MTQAEYLTVTGHNPSYYAGTTNPVERVTWYDAVEFCNLLSERQGLRRVYTITNRVPASGYPVTNATVTMDETKNGFRLPTEAEWEYAAKGGNWSPGNYVYSGSNDIGAVGWYAGNSGNTTHPVGAKFPNGLGLYDMSGNVWEWCWDWYSVYSPDVQVDPSGPASGGTRTARGGGLFHVATRSRSTERNFVDAHYKAVDLGFRIVRRTGTGIP